MPISMLKYRESIWIVGKPYICRHSHQKKTLIDEQQIDDANPLFETAKTPHST